MACKFVLFSFFIISSALVDSFPYPEGNIDGTYNLGIQQNDLGYFQSPSYPMVNPWSLDQGISPSTQSPINAWNHNYNNIEEQGHQFDTSNSARTVNANNYGQANNYDTVTPVATLQNGYGQWRNTFYQHPTTATPHNVNEGWWNSPQLQQQQQSYFYGKPYEANSFTQSYAQPYANQGNYGLGFSQYQSPGLINLKPAESYNSYQGWPQNQHDYISTTSTPIKYLPWPLTENQDAQPIQTSFLNEYNKPAPGNDQSENLGKNPEPEQTDGQEPMLKLQQPVNNQTIIPKRYIIVHMNGTYEHINDLHDIVIDEFNIAHIKSKDALNQVLAIIEMEDANEMENPVSLEVPYDTGITKIPRDAEWSTDIHESPHTHQSYKLPITQDTTEDTTYDMKYFQPEYIMPIQSTTENTIDSTTNSLPPTTTTKGNILVDKDKNRLETYSSTENTTSGTDLTAKDSVSTTGGISDSTIVNTTESTTVSIIDSTNNCTTDSTIVSSTGSSTYNVDATTEPSQHSTADANNKEQEYIFTTQTTDIPQRVQTFSKYYDEDYDYREETESTTETSRIDKDLKGNTYNDIDKIQSRNISKRTVNKRDYQRDNPAFDYEQEKNSNDNGDDKPLNRKSKLAPASSNTSETKGDSENENCSNKDNPPTTEKPFELREDLKIDVSELKTAVGEPYVWFRKDADFWDKVTKGEQAYDSIIFYDVDCKPKLIERITTIHHYANGTESVEYVELIWDSPDAISPREIKSNREIWES